MKHINKSGVKYLKDGMIQFNINKQYSSEILLKIDDIVSIDSHRILDVMHRDFKDSFNRMHSINENTRFRIHISPQYLFVTTQQFIKKIFNFYKSNRTDK